MIDLVYINGYGCPARRGDPMLYADTIELEKVYERVVKFECQHGDWWQPANLLKKLAKGRQTLCRF